MSLNQAYEILYGTVFLALAIMAGIMLIRSVKGPRITDRILSVNMLGTMVICSIAILSQLLKESYLVDVALIYAMISFVVVVMLANMYIPTNPKPPIFPGTKEWEERYPTSEGRQRRYNRKKR